MMIRDTLLWLEDSENPLLVSQKSYNYFMGEEVVLLISFSPEETLFYEKLQVAINERLFPAKILTASELSSTSFRPKLLLATRQIPHIRAPFILISPPTAYQNKEAKAALWKTLCQTLSPPPSS